MPTNIKLECENYKKRRKQNIIFSIYNLTLLIAALLVSIFFSDEIAYSVSCGLSLVTNVIIPSVFPFMIISDALRVFVHFDSLEAIGNLFERIFKINRAGLSAFILGILCGFPLGVKEACDLYNDGKISKDEAERLIGFCNNTGPAFLISGVGAGLRGNIAEGILLYIVMLISAICVGFIFSAGKSVHEKCLTDTHCEYNFSLTVSIKNAGQNTLAISSFLTFFACICGCLRKLLGQSYPYIMLLPFLEIGNATSILSKTPLLTDVSSLALSAFAVGFSGFSVHMQALSFIKGSDINTRRYFIMKLLQGIISMVIIIPLHALFCK